MNTERKRAILSWAYPGERWLKKVLDMSDEQVNAVFMYNQERGKLKGISEDVRTRELEDGYATYVRTRTEDSAEEGTGDSDGPRGDWDRIIGGAAGSADTTRTPDPGGAPESTEGSQEHPKLF